jgi:hypothetical protein
LATDWAAERNGGSPQLLVDPGETAETQQDKDDRELGVCAVLQGWPAELRHLNGMAVPLDPGVVLARVRRWAPHQIPVVGNTATQTEGRTFRFTWAGLKIVDGVRVHSYTYSRELSD